MLNVAQPLDCQLCHEQHKCRLVSSSEESDGTMDDISSFTGESYSSSFSTFSSDSEENLSVTGTESSRGSDDERHFGIRAIRLKSPQTGFDGNAVSEWILIDSKSEAGNSNLETSEDGSVSDDLSRTGELESTTCSSSLSSEWPLFEVIENKEEDVRSCSTAKSNSSTSQSISTDTESLPYSPVYIEVEDQGSSGNDTPSEGKIEVIFKKLGVSSSPSEAKPSGASETSRQFPKRHGWVPRHQRGFPRPGFQHPHAGFPSPPNGFQRPQGGFPGYPPRQYPPHPSFPPRQPPFVPKFMPHPPPNSAPRDFFPERRFSEFQKPHPKASSFVPKQFPNAPTPKFQQPSPPNVNVPQKPYLSKPPAPQTLAAQPEPPKEAALSAGLPPGHVLVPMYCNQDPQGSLRYTPLGYVDPVRQDVMSIPCVCMKIEEFLKMAYSPETPYERISRSEITRVGV